MTERSFRVVPVPIGQYADEAFDSIDADGSAERVASVLVPYGGAVVEWDRSAVRDMAWVAERMDDWAREPSDGDGDLGGLLYWVGHGESTGEEAWLVTSTAGQYDKSRGHGSQQLANAIEKHWLKRSNSPDAWAIVVIEACGAERFIELASVECNRKATAPKRLALVAAGNRNTSFMGHFESALRRALSGYSAHDETIRIGDLVQRIEQFLGDDGTVIAKGLAGARPLRQPIDVPPFTAPQDVYLELMAALAGLPDDQKAHFVPKAQAAEQGELPWYFAGRAAERREIAAWIRAYNEGLLVVTGAAGSGKSALLGNVLVQSNPKLRTQLVQLRLIDDLDEDERPPDDTFTAALLLTGMSTSDLVDRLATDIGLGVAPEAAEVSGRIEWLLDEIRSCEGRHTILADALDEAQEPYVAASVLRRIAGISGCRVVVGTRRSTNEGPDLPQPRDENLLDVLGGRTRLAIVTVPRDPGAIAQYVRSRLRVLDASPRRIEEIAAAIAERGREFLFARLAVHEIFARPELVDDSHRDELAEMLRNDHRTLFAVAVRRLSAVRVEHRYLLEALAHAQGRGLPRADQIWAIVASAVGMNHPIGEADIDSVLEDAAPYITLDGEHGQSVYRLAHRTFQEHFLAV